MTVLVMITAFNLILNSYLSIGMYRLYTRKCIQVTPFNLFTTLIFSRSLTLLRAAVLQSSF